MSACLKCANMRHEKTPLTEAALLQRRANHRKFRAQCGADTLDGGNDRNRDASGYQTVFDGGGPSFIGQESANGFHWANMMPILKGRLNLFE